MKKNIALNQKNLDSLDPSIEIPNYDRGKVKTRIAHIGVGNFHRSHQAYLTHELMQQHGDLNSGICGIGLMNFDRKISDVMKAQDSLYSLVIKEHDGSRKVKVIGSIVEFLFAPENPDAVIAKLADPEIQVISLTITEGGYNLDETTHEFNFENPWIQQEIADPNSPITVFGYLNKALQVRKDTGAGGVTIQSCDNIQGNGKITKKSLLSFIGRVNPDLLDWISENVSFPNAMVDRITPITTLQDIQQLKDDFLVDDQWPVVCEPFIQWVIEDDFINGRPSWEKVGVQFVNDVLPFENMKLQLLNAGHSLMGVLGALHGFETIDQVVRDNDFKEIFKNYMDLEVTPCLEKLDGFDLTAYKNSLLTRFQNEYIKDSVARICSHSSVKFPKFILPTLRNQLSNSQDIEIISFLIAAWAKYNLGIDEKGTSYEIKDVILEEELKIAAKESLEDPLKFIQLNAIFGDLYVNEVFSNRYLYYTDLLKEQSVRACIKQINARIKT